MATPNSGTPVPTPAPTASSGEKELFGHPRGLYVLFFTELWERFSFYSMRGILTLYMVAVILAASGEANEKADHIYAAYLGFVYASTFVGGMLADRLLGQRRAIYIGGTLMALAQFTLAGHALLARSGHDIVSLNWMFFLGLGLLSCGNGFFKPNISTIVGTLYRQGDARRDVAFTIFYMGINIGAFLASFMAGIAQKWGWHLGFMMAGCGMVLGQIIFAFGRRTIHGKGLPPEGATLVGQGRFGVPNILVLVVGVAAFIPLAGYLISQPTWVQDLAIWLAGPIVAYLLWEAARSRDGAATKRGSLGLLAIGTAVAAEIAFVVGKFGQGMGLPSWLWIGPLIAAGAGVFYLVALAARSAEGGRMIVIVVLCSFSMMFWGFFELAGSTITRFTEDAVDRVVSGSEIPAAFLANFVNPLLIIVLSIPVAGLWVWLDRRRAEPSSPFKFVMGLGQLSLGFFMLYLGAKQAETSGKAAMVWLILGFFFHTTGELCLSPVGLSTITKLAPARLVGMFMGVWFLSSALGNVLAPMVAGVKEGQGFNDVFLKITLITAGGAAVLFVLVRPLKKMMHGVK